MKKIIPIIIAIILLAVIGGFIYYKYYYPYSGNAPEISQKELDCGAYYGDYNQKKPGTPNDWVNSGRGTFSALWHAPGKYTHPMDCYKEPPIVGGCAGVSLDNLQECCNLWAQENQIVHIQCVGNWAIKDNKCAWDCSAN